MKSVSSNGIIGSDQPRIDGPVKVTGAALYGADHVLPNTAYAWLRTSEVALGHIRSIDDKEARHVPGVLDVLTYRNVGKAIKPGKHIIDGGYMSHSVAPLLTNRIAFGGQIVAVVIAETIESAQAAAELLVIDYLESTPAATFQSATAKEVEARALGETELSVGNPERGLSFAAAVVDAWYTTPPQHHNPLELFQTTCSWEGDELTVWESSQNVRGYQYGLAKQLGIKPANIRVISEFIGGAFGSRGELGQHTALIALASRRLGRPVKHVASRTQCFTLRTFRAETRHHVQLGADREGRLTALLHDGWELTGRADHFAVAGSESTARLYACPNVQVKVWNVEADRQAPGFMRAPPETPYMFALESAMDELAYALRMDPLELRRRNDTAVETVTNRPYTSRTLLPCIETGASLFGWGDRDPRPAAMRDGDELVGYGYATAFYPTQVGPAECRVILSHDLKVTVEVGTHEIGTGIRTVIAQTAGEFLGVPVSAVEVCIGDSRLPAAPMSAGSNSTASVCSVVARACEYLKERIARAAVKATASPLYGLEPFQIHLRSQRLEAGGISEPLNLAVYRTNRGRPLVQRASHSPHGAPPLIGQALVDRGKPLMLGGSRLKDRMQFAHGAHFVEVRIDRWTGQIRVPRMVGVFAAGRIMNTRTAKAQLQGGQLWGLSSALFEATEVDERSAQYVNSDLSEYHVPVNADCLDIQTVMLDESDTEVNPLGIKGVGELGVTGVNAAVANAVFHATGTRLRDLPIRAGDFALPPL